MIKKNKYLIVILLLLLFFLPFSFFEFEVVKAETLSDNINSQIENLDLAKLDSISSELESNDGSFKENFYNIINGKYVVDYENFFEYLKEIAFNKVKEYLNNCRKNQG